MWNFINQQVAVAQATDDEKSAIYACVRGGAGMRNIIFRFSIVRSRRQVFLLLRLLHHLVLHLCVHDLHRVFLDHLSVRHDESAGASTRSTASDSVTATGRANTHSVMTKEYIVVLFGIGAVRTIRTCNIDHSVQDMMYSYRSYMNIPIDYVLLRSDALSQFGSIVDGARKNVLKSIPLLGAGGETWVTSETGNHERYWTERPTSTQMNQIDWYVTDLYNNVLSDAVFRVDYDIK